MVENQSTHVTGDSDELDLKLARDCSRFYADPYGFVMWAFDWGYGELHGFDGPDTWQKEVMDSIGKRVKEAKFNGVDAVDPIRDATASGHGIGKSALTSWLVLWIMSTRPFAKGTVTANTSDQLKTKTWAEVGKWRARCLTGHWFEYSSGRGSMSMYHKEHKQSWRVDAQTCREENSEAFAGQHAANSTSFYIFDEASAVPDSIFEVAEGGLTDGEPMFFCFGNPTRNSGKFYEMFTNKRWNTRQIDSRDAKFTNKKIIKQWIEDNGEDSDFVRVRVRGMFPRAGDNQFIPMDVCEESMEGPTPRYLPDEPLIMGIDCSRGGGDDSMIQLRRGFDARSDLTYRIKSDDTKDSMVFASKTSLVIERHKPDAIFIDAGGLGGPIADRLRQLGHTNVFDVKFSNKATDEETFGNKITEMAFRCRKWMMKGGRIKNDIQLKRELTAREYKHDSQDRMVLEPKKEFKKRLGYSPDWADSLYLTFAEYVPPLDDSRQELDSDVYGGQNGNNGYDYDPIDFI